MRTMKSEVEEALDFVKKSVQLFPYEGYEQ